MESKETLNQEGQTQEGQEGRIGDSSAPKTHGETKSTLEYTPPASPAAEPQKPEEGKEKEGKEPPVEDQEGKEAEGKEAKTEEGKIKEGKETIPEGKEKPTEKPTGDDTRLDKHPRFQQLIRQNADLREANAQLTGRLDTLEKVVTAKGEAGETKGPTYKNILAMSNEEINEQIGDDPKGFFSNLLNQALSEIKEDISKGMDGRYLTKEGAEGMLSKGDQDRLIATGYEQFAKDNPKFNEMWSMGEIQEYMDSRPWHTPISAFYELTKGGDEESIKGQIKTAVDEAVEKATKETEDRVRKEMVAKGGAATLPASPGAAPKGPQTDARLKDSKKYGGRDSVLADMLKEERTAAQ